MLERYRRIILAAIPLALVVSCSEGISRSVLTTVLRVDGDVQAAGNENASFGQISAGARFSSGMILRTGQGTLDLQIMPGLQVRLGPNSELKLEQMTLARDGNETASGMSDRVAKLVLRYGRATVYLQDADGSWGTLTVATEEVTIGSRRGCLFQVETAEGQTRLVCSRGNLFASAPKGSSSTIPGGYFAEWPLTQPPSPAEGDSAAQNAVAESLKTAQELDQLLEKQTPYIPW